MCGWDHPDRTYKPSRYPNQTSDLVLIYCTVQHYWKLMEVDKMSLSWGSRAVETALPPACVDLQLEGGTGYNMTAAPCQLSCQSRCYSVRFYEVKFGHATYIGGSCLPNFEQWPYDWLETIGVIDTPRENCNPPVFGNRHATNSGPVPNFQNFGFQPPKLFCTCGIDWLLGCRECEFRTLKHLDVAQKQVSLSISNSIYITYQMVDKSLSHLPYDT